MAYPVKNLVLVWNVNIQGVREVGMIPIGQTIRLKGYGRPIGVISGHNGIYYYVDVVIDRIVYSKLLFQPQSFDVVYLVGPNDETSTQR